MTPYRLAGFEMIEPSAEVDWPGEPDNLPNLVDLGIDVSFHRNVYQREVIDILPPIKTVASPGFTACSGIIVRDNDSGIPTFGHLQPEVMSFERHMQGRNIKNGEAAVLIGEASRPPDALWDLRDGRWGNIDTRVISFESGSTWWAAVFDVMSGRVSIARRKPRQSILQYAAFPSKDR